MDASLEYLKRIRQEAKPKLGKKNVAQGEVSSENSRIDFSSLPDFHFDDDSLFTQIRSASDPKVNLQKKDQPPKNIGVT